MSISVLPAVPNPACRRSPPGARGWASGQVGRVCARGLHPGLGRGSECGSRLGSGLSCSPLGESETKAGGAGGAHRLRLRDSPFILNSQRQRARGWSCGARAGPPTARRDGGAAAPGRAGGRRGRARGPGPRGRRHGGAPRGGERACVCVRERV
jgi:hypothetical protein